MSTPYTPTPDMLPGYAAGADYLTQAHLFPTADVDAVERFLIDRGRANHYHRSESARDKACEQGRRRKENKRRKAAARAARVDH